MIFFIGLKKQLHAYQVVNKSTQKVKLLGISWSIKKSIIKIYNESYSMVHSVSRSEMEIYK